MAEQRPASKIERFEDLIAWQRARELTRLVFQVTTDGALARNFGLVDQLQRASVSVMSNIAEGFERGGRAEFQQFLSTAKASCAETRSLFYVALDAQLIDQATFERLRTCAEEVARVVGGLRGAVERQRAHQANQRTPRRVS